MLVDPPLNHAAGAPVQTKLESDANEADDFPELSWSLLTKPMLGKFFGLGQRKTFPSSLVDPVRMPKNGYGQ